MVTKRYQHLPKAVDDSEVLQWNVFEADCFAYVDEFVFFEYIPAGLNTRESLNEANVKLILLL